MSLLHINEQGKLKYCGHILETDNSLEKVIMQEKVEEKRRMGRPRRRQLDEIMKKLELNLESTLKLTTNKNEWRKATHEVTRSRYRLDGR